MPLVFARLRGSLDLLIPFALLIAALLLWIDAGRAIRDLRAIVFDGYQRLSPRPYLDPPVRIVDIDEPSLKAIGQWPWPRERLAAMVDRLAEQGAAAVALDIILSEPDRTSPANLAKLWQDRPDIEQIRRALAFLPDPDAQLAEALGRAPTVVGFLLADNGSPPNLAPKAGFATAGDDPLQFVPAFAAAVPALPAFEAAATGYGSVNVVPDPDGRTRRVQLFFATDGGLYPTLASETLRVAQGASGFVIKSSGSSGEPSFGRPTGIVEVKIGAAVVPTDGSGALLLYDSGHRPERFVSAASLLDGSNDPAKVAGHIVLIGSSAEALKDLKPSPLDATMPGVEVTAQAIEQMIGRQFLHRPDWAAGAELLFLAFFGSAVILATRRVGAVGSALFALAACAIAAEFSWLVFKYRGWLVDPVYPIAVALLLYVTSSFLGYLRTEGERRFVRTAFGQYVSPALLQQLTRRPDMLRVGGEERELTVLFLDIQGFTSIAESLDPATLTRVMNRFLTPMTRIIQEEYEGTIDKYIGDAIMAFWNAPTDDPDHPLDALEAALAMRAELARLNEIWAAEAAAAGTAPVRLSFGIGINTGRCSVGNMGSDQRFDYTAIGDTVNLASRLEGLTRAYGVDLIVGEATAAQLPGADLIEVDRVRVKGRQQPIAVFTAPSAKPGNGADRFAELKPLHDRFLAHYRAGRLTEAGAELAALTALAAAEIPYLDGLYGLYDRRLAALRETPPAADWDGVFVAASKTG